MKLSRIILTITLCLAFSAAARGQYYYLGDDPASARWNILKTDNFRVIYPNGLDSLAREFLYNFEISRPRTQVGLKIKQSEIPIVLHPYVLTSNATVVWAPRRLDVFSTPPFNSGYADDWTHQLALHEGRHIGQCTHFTTGTFALFKYLIGEQGVGLGMGFYPTGWELEGDAVHSESEFSRTGRARDANFLMPYKATFLEGEVHQYDVYRFNSYYNYIPDKYSFGYIVETFMRHNSDYYVFGDIYHDYTRYWYDPSILNKAYQKYTGRTRRKNFNGAVAYFTDMWQKDYASRAPYTDFSPVSNFNDRYYSVYHSVMPAGDGRVVAVKSGMSHVSQLVSIDSTGREKFIRPFAAKNLTSPLVLRDGHTLVWSEIVAHPRWELKHWSEIRSYDLTTGKMRTLTRRTRYFNPAYSPDGNIVSVTEYPVAGGSKVVLLDASTMKPTGSIGAPGGGQIHYTAWIGDRIYADAILGDGQWGIWSRPAGDPYAEWEEEIAPQTRSILRMHSTGDRLMFESDLDGVTNVYTYIPSAHRLQKLTNARYGAFYPHLTGEGELYCSDYDRRGYLPAKAQRGDLLWEEASFDEPYHFEIADNFSAQADTMAPALSVERQAEIRRTVDSLPSKRYYKTTHLFNIHSWAPFYAGVNRIMNMSYDHYYQLAALGATLISQNVLGTATTIFGYSYHDGRHAGHFNFNYSGLWPIFELNVDFNDRARGRIRYAEGVGPVDTTYTDKPALDVSGAVYTSIGLGRGGWNSAMIPRVEFNWNQDLYGVGDVFHQGRDLQASLRYYCVLPKTRANRMPRLGVGAEVKGVYQMGPYDGDAKVLYGYTYGYIPGFTIEQGLKLTAMGQKRFDSVGAGALMKNVASLPRGYRNIPLNDYFKVTADYAIPIPVNDWAPVPILWYLMRVNVSPFMDYAVNKTAAGDLQQMMAYGSAVTFQGHLFRIGFELELGARVTRYYDFIDHKWKFRADAVTNLGL